MKIRKSTRTIDGYQIRKQQAGKFKITEYSHVDGQPTSARKRTIYKDLLLTDAQAIVFKLESNNK